MMKSVFSGNLRLLPLAILLALNPPLQAQSVPPGQAIMPVSNIQPGMKAVGLTVFKGSRIEQFDAEILGVLKKARTQGDLIIARLSGGPLETTGVIAGMSGSPVYISNRLIGAVAFSWTFSKEAIAGITPIEDMLTTFDQTDPTNDFSNPDYYPRTSPPGPTGRAGQQDEPFRYSGVEMRKVQTPLVFSGIDDRLFEAAKSGFEDMNFLPLLGGADDAGGASSGTPGQALSSATNPFKPGSAVAIRLVTGDINVSGVGTVTYVDGKRMLIFGHPMFQRGACSFPVALASIVTVFPGYSTSFKIATAGTIVGRTIQDRQYAVSCDVGVEPPMLPVTVRQSYRGERKQYSYRIVNDYLLLQNFLGLCVIDSVIHDKSPQEKNSFYITISLHLGDGSTVRLANMYSELTTAQNLNQSMAEIAQSVMSLVLNPFKPVRLESIDVDVQQSDEIHIATIRKLRLKTPGEINPGGTIDLEIGFEIYQDRTWTTNLRLTLPGSLPEGPLTIFVTSSPEERRTDNLLSPDALIPRTYGQLVEFLEGQPKNNEVIVWGLVRSPGLVINGEKFFNLPPSRMNVLLSSQEDVVEPMLVKFKTIFATPYNVYDMRKITIPVKNPRFWR